MAVDAATCCGVQSAWVTQVSSIVCASIRACQSARGDVSQEAKVSQFIQFIGGSK